jgi:putative tryptophan/tyrosine transport system substrate-binding protein
VAVGVHAQQPGKLPTIGFLGAAPSIESQRVVALSGGSANSRGSTVATSRVYRWAEGRDERYAEIAAEFVRLRSMSLSLWQTQQRSRQNKRQRSSRSFS